MAITVWLLDGPWIFIQDRDQIYSALKHGPIMSDGTLAGMHWFCPLWQWQERQDQHRYPFNEPKLTEEEEE